MKHCPAMTDEEYDEFLIVARLGQEVSFFYSTSKFPNNLYLHRLCWPHVRGFDQRTESWKSCCGWELDEVLSLFKDGEYKLGDDHFYLRCRAVDAN